MSSTRIDVVIEIEIETETEREGERRYPQLSIQQKKYKTLDYILCQLGENLNKKIIHIFSSSEFLF